MELGSFKKVIKNTSLVSVGTFISLFLGLIRDILVAAVFGTSAILEAFIVAFRLPNLFRSIFAEGFSDSVAVPVLSEYRKDKQVLFALGNRLLSVLVVVLTLATVLGILFAKPLVAIIAPGFVSYPQKFAMAVSFSRITFLYLFFIGISVNGNSLLSVLKKFFVPALAPSFLNLSFIVGVIFFSRFFSNYILVMCVVTAGILQAIFPFVILRREGFRVKVSFRQALGDAEIIRMFKLFVPRIASSIVYQLNVIIDTIFYSLSAFVGSGALAAHWFAHRFIHFPLALVALPVSRVAIVDLSSYHKERNMEDFKKLFVFSFQNIVFFIFPIAAFYLFVPHSIIEVLFFRGGFTQYSLKLTSSVLFFYSFGLFFFCYIKLLVSAFYALKDTMTPTKVTAISLLINAALSALFMVPMKAGGVALGSSLAAAANAVLLYHSLVRKVGPFNWQDTRTQLVKVFLLSVAVGLVARGVWSYIPLQKYLRFLLMVALSGGLFFGAGRILKLKQITYVWGWMVAVRNKKHD